MKPKKPISPQPLYPEATSISSLKKDVVGDWSLNPRTKVEFRHLLAEIESLEQQLLPCKQKQSKNLCTMGTV